MRCKDEDHTKEFIQKYIQKTFKNVSYDILDIPLCIVGIVLY